MGLRWYTGKYLSHVQKHFCIPDAAKDTFPLASQVPIADSRKTLPPIDISAIPMEGLAAMNFKFSTRIDHSRFASHVRVCQAN